MSRYKKMDSILLYMSKNLDSIPRRPDAIIKRSKLEIEYNESYRMFQMMLDDKYVYEHYSQDKKTGTYGITYKGILFFEKGGYTREYSNNKIKIRASKLSDLADLVIKPIGVVTAFLICIWYVIKFLVFFGVIKDCIA